MTFIPKFDPFQSQWLQPGVKKQWCETPVPRPSPRGAQREILIVFGLSLLLATSGQAVVIAFSNPLPVVVVNETARISVSIDRGNSTTQSLFSYGISVMGDWESQGIVPLGVVVPPSLDFNGVAGPGAFIGGGAEFIGVKGTVNLSVNPISLYEGTALAEFQFRFTQPGTYSFILDFFNTLGPTEDIFVNQDGMAIDDEIEFRPGLVQVVVPEPRISTLILVAGLCLFITRARMRRLAVQP
jgi:hypothetical protein